MRPRSCARSLASLTLLALAAACVDLQPKIAEPIAAPSDAAGSAVVRPGVDATAPVDLPGLHNVVAYGPRVLSGSVPAGREGLESLAAMGIATVVSVDGATPDVETAKSLGLRYIHLPISYDAVPEERRRELAQVVANTEGPIYMHCHHGKHRSAAAVATAMVTAGVLTEAEAEARMKVSGTSPNYPGLWRSLHECAALQHDALVADVSTFPAIATVTGLVATMSELDVVYDNVRAAQKAGWKVPADHPDLVPEKETRRIHALFAQLVDDPESAKLPAHYQDQLQAVIAATASLDTAVRGRDYTLADQQFDVLAKSCKTCHKDYRDQ